MNPGEAELRRFEKRLVPEERFAEAYDSVSPALCALHKHALAAQYAMFGEMPDEEYAYRVRRAEDLYVSRHTRPVDWALTVFEAGYGSAVRLLAALMPAVLARVPLTPVLCIGGEPLPEILCALEAAGREQVYALDGKQGPAFFQALCAGNGLGRLVLLRSGGRPDAFRRAAEAAETACWEERRPPVLHIADNKVDVESVRRAHPDAALFAGVPPKCAPDAVYGPPNAGIPLTLAAGMEGCWVHRGLTPDFFRESCLALALGGTPAGEAV